MISSIWVPTLNTGFSASSGSCGMKPMRLPRTLTFCSASENTSRFSPSNMIVAGIDASARAAEYP